MSAPNWETVTLGEHRKMIAEKDAEIERLKALLIRAADALDNGDLAIFDELRKAAE